MPRMDYEQRQEARRERLEARAGKFRREADRRSLAGWEALHAIPFGQPIMVGHYSEKRDRNYRARAIGNIDKSVELSKKAGELEARASNIGAGGISSDDPTAIEQLEAKLIGLEARQEAMKKANADWRRAGNKAGRQEDGRWIDGPFASYQLTNNNARIKSTRQRIEQLKREGGREFQEVETNSGFKIVQNTDDNRIQIIFDDKPPADVRTVLKSHGFRWAPSVGAWQRLLNNAGVYAAKAVRAKLEQES